MGLTFNLGRVSPSVFTDSSLNVGIGAAPSGSYKLEVTGNGKFTSASFPLDIYGTTNNYGLRINNVQAATLFLYSSNANAASRNWGLFTNSEVYGDFDIRQSNAINGDLTNGANSTSRFYIKNNGNVGIGTSSPTNLLHVSKDLTGEAIAQIANTSATGFGLAINAGGGTRYALAISSYDFTPIARFLANGNVFINATSSINGAQFYVQGNSVQAGEFYTNGISNTAALLVQKSTNDTSTSQVFIRFLHNSGSVGSGQINANGASSAAFGSYSDKRLKENITDLPSQLSNILALRAVEFNYIESEGGGHQIGFIAQEMEKIYPDVVGKREDDMLTITGWSKTEARLVKAIQEQQATITSLQERLNKAGL